MVRSIVYEAVRLISIFVLVGAGLSVLGAVSAFVLASFASCFSLLYLLIRNYGSLIRGYAEKVRWNKVLRFTGYLTIGSVTWVVYAYIDSIMIGVFLPAEDVGFYRAAYNIIGAVSGLVSIPAVLFPVFVQLEGRDLNNAFSRAFRFSSIIAFPAVAGLALLSKQVIRFVYGPDYLQAALPMMVLSLLIFRSALGFWAVLFNFKEMPEYPVYISFAGMLINVVLNYFFILAYGIVGAAIATVVSNAITWVAMAVASRRLLGIFFDYRDLVKPFISSAVMVLMLSLTEFTSLLDAVLKVAGGAMLYFGILFLVRGIGKEDVQYLRKVVAGRQK